MAEKLTLEKLVELGNIPSSTLQEQAKGSIIYDDFKCEPVCVAPAGAGAATGTTGDENILLTEKHSYRYHMLGAGQTIVGFSNNAKGLDITLDDANNEGCEIIPSLTAWANGYMTVGTDAAFYVKVTANITTPDEISPFYVGFRKSEAFQADYNDYDELAAIGISGDSTDAIVKTCTILNNAATSEIDSTQDAVAATDTTFYVEVSASGVVTFKWGAASLAAPTVTQSFTFDSGEKVIPFVHFLHHTNTADGVYLKKFEVGYVSEQV